VWQHRSGEVGNEYTTFYISDAIYMSKVIEIDGNLPKF